MRVFFNSHRLSWSVGQTVEKTHKKNLSRFKLDSMRVSGQTRARVSTLNSPHLRLARAWDSSLGLNLFRVVAVKRHSVEKLIASPGMKTVYCLNNGVLQTRTRSWNLWFCFISQMKRTKEVWPLVLIVDRSLFVMPTLPVQQIPQTRNVTLVFATKALKEMVLFVKVGERFFDG